MCIYIYVCVWVCVCAFVFMFEPCRNWETFYTIHKFFCGVADHGHCSLFHSGLLSFYFDLFRSCSDSDAHIPILIYIIIVHFVICIYIYIVDSDAHIPKYCMCICFCCCCCCRWCCCRFFCTVRHAATIPWHADPGQPRSLPATRWSNAQKKKRGFFRRGAFKTVKRLPFGFNCDLCNGLTLG